jgi:hypothetical protein
MAYHARAPVLSYLGPPGRPPPWSPAALPGLPVAVLGAGALRRGRALVAAAQRRVADAAAQACRTHTAATAHNTHQHQDDQSTCRQAVRSGTRLARQSNNRPARGSFVQQRAEPAARQGAPLPHQRHRRSAMQAFRMRLHHCKPHAPASPQPEGTQRGGAARTAEGVGVAVLEGALQQRAEHVRRAAALRPGAGRVARGPPHNTASAFIAPLCRACCARALRSCAGRCTVSGASTSPTRARSCSQTCQPLAAMQDPGDPGACLRGCR